LAVATAALGIWWTGPWINGPGDVSTPALSGAIIPFHAVGADPAHAAVDDALTQPLTTNRSQRPRLTVTAPSGTGAFRGQALDANRPGRDLHVRCLVEGELMPQADQLLLTERLIEAETARQPWARQFELAPSATADQQAPPQGQVTLHVRRALGSALGSAAAARAAKRADASTPTDLVHRGHAAWSHNESAGWRVGRVGRESFDQALRLDPDYGPALVAKGWTLAREFAQDRVRPEARVLAEFEAVSARATAADPGEDDAWKLRAVALSHLQRWGKAFAAAERGDRARARRSFQSRDARQAPVGDGSARASVRRCLCAPPRWILLALPSGTARSVARGC